MDSSPNGITRITISQGERIIVIEGSIVATSDGAQHPRLSGEHWSGPDELLGRSTREAPSVKSHEPREHWSGPDELMSR